MRCVDLKSSFQTYTTSTILLHSVVQKQLHNFKPSSWADELQRVRDCLSVLAFCGSQDRVAAQFHGQLEAIFQVVLAYGLTRPPKGVPLEMDSQQNASQSNGTSSSMYEAGNQTRSQSETHAYLLDIPADADPSHIRLSFSLLMMLSQPFGDSSNKEAAELNLKKHWLTDPSRYEYPQMAERIDWSLENKHMFQWDLDKLNIPPLYAMKVSEPSSLSDESPDSDLSDSMFPASFLGSFEPSGWASAASLTNPIRN